jgi:hypothetical protein
VLVLVDDDELEQPAGADKGHMTPEPFSAMVLARVLLLRRAGYRPG